MNKKALDEKYSYQIDEHNVVHLFRGEDDCQQYLTNPLLSAIFKIETLEKGNAEFKEQLYAFDKEREKLRKENAEVRTQLTNAKNYLRFLLGVVHIKNTYNELIEEQITEAKQFLKETEE